MVKMKKIKMFYFISFMAFVLSLVFTSCGFFGPQKYVCDENEVKSIQIVKLDSYDNNEYTYGYTVLAEIEDQSTFIKRLNDLKHTVNWGDPMVLKEGYIVVKIVYLNGDYDLFHYDAQFFHRKGVNNSGFFFFDKDEFNLLISDYVSDADLLFEGFSLSN